MFNANSNSEPDFSELLMQAQNRPEGGNRGVPENDRYRKDSGAERQNSNISNILTAIKDDGPALHHDSERSPLHDSLLDEAHEEDIYHPSDRRRPHQSAAPIRPERAAAAPAKLPGWNAFFLPALMMVCITSLCLTGYLQYQLYNRIIKLEDSLPLTGATGDEALNADAVELLGADIELLKSGLKAIDASLFELNSRDVDALTQMSGELNEQVKNQLAKSNELKLQIERINSGMKRVESEVGAVKSLVAQMRNRKSVLQGSVQNKLTVNLASLSKREQAERAMEMLAGSGVVPTIEQSIVNGKTMYRLSVTGFGSREEAAAFVKKAKDRYGFAGAWIR